MYYIDSNIDKHNFVLLIVIAMAIALAIAHEVQLMLLRLSQSGLCCTRTATATQCNLHRAKTPRGVHAPLHIKAKLPRMSLKQRKQLIHKNNMTPNNKQRNDK